MIDFVALVGLGGMVALLAGRITSNLRYLARLEPPNVVKQGRREGGS